MKNIRIKILKDTPFHKKDTKLTVDDFRADYNTICVSTVSNDELVEYIKDYNSHPQLTTMSSRRVAEGNISEWFGVVQEYDYVYRVGDWVWHEELKKAFCVLYSNSDIDRKEFKPNCVTFEAANQYASTTYKRKATQEEIDRFDLTFFCDKRILVGRTECYYYNNTWKKLTGVKENVSKYMTALNSMRPIAWNLSHPISHECRLNGMKVGCINIPHEEVVKIAKELGL